MTISLYAWVLQKDPTTPNGSKANYPTEFFYSNIELTLFLLLGNGHQWASYQIRKIASCACAGNAGNDFPCVTHVPWCMSGPLTRGGGENVRGIPGACAPTILRIWQEAHCETFRQAEFGEYEVYFVLSSDHLCIYQIWLACRAIISDMTSQITEDSTAFSTACIVWP